MDFKHTVKPYYYLSKPGIVYSNVITAVAGYLFAAQLHIQPKTLLGLAFGIALVIAGACAYNNYLDRSIDSRMKRTQKRALVTGKISGKQALVYGTTATLLGIILLAFTQNTLTTLLTITAWFAYVVVYGYAKRVTVHGTLVGCISGSLPLAIGYTSVSNAFDLGAVLLFLLMVAWQMAHFYGIALYRRKDYINANIPVMPAVHGAAATKPQVIGYICLFIVAGALLVVTGYLGAIGGLMLGALGLVWLYKALSTYNLPASDAWGKRVFLFSLIVLLGMSVTLSVGSSLA